MRPLPHLSRPVLLAVMTKIGRFDGHMTLTTLMANSSTTIYTIVFVSRPIVINTTEAGVKSHIVFLVRTASSRERDMVGPKTMYVERPAFDWFLFDVFLT